MQLAIAHFLLSVGYVVNVDESGHHYYRDTDSGCHSVYIEENAAHMYYTSADGEGQECQFGYTVQEFKYLIQVCK
jgi:hypothetical protein